MIDYWRFTRLVILKCHLDLMGHTRQHHNYYYISIQEFLLEKHMPSPNYFLFF